MNSENTPASEARSPFDRGVTLGTLFRGDLTIDSLAKSLTRGEACFVLSLGVIAMRLGVAIWMSDEVWLFVLAAVRSFVSIAVALFGVYWVFGASGALGRRRKLDDGTH